MSAGKLKNLPQGRVGAALARPLHSTQQAEPFWMADAKFHHHACLLVQYMGTRRPESSYRSFNAWGPKRFVNAYSEAAS
jgi:hypothetical protein